MIERLRQREEWQFFAELPRASRSVTVAWWIILLMRGLLPAAFAVAAGLLVGSVQRGTGVVGALVGVGAVFVVVQILSPLQAQVGANLGERLTGPRRPSGWATGPGWTIARRSPGPSRARGRTR